MSSTSLSLPCPVRLGIVREAGPRAELHRYTLERNLAKMDRLLRKGVDVDCVNDEGQSALFIACLLGLKGPAEVLLKHGANPNHRCFDQSTPVHAAVFSCSSRLVSVLLDAGGDLRLHDKRGHAPQHWATSGGQPNAKKMLEFLQSCMVQMQSVVHRRLPGETPCSPSSSKMLLPPSPLKHLLRLGGCDVTLGKKSGGGSWSSVQCFGFGKVCTERRGRLLGLQACVPLVSDVELTHTQDEPPTTFTLADCTQMSNLSWRGCRVTVKDLVPLSGSCEDQSEYSYRDLLQREHEYCSRLLHPHLLQQLAVALGADLHTRLVFERVHIGPLHTIIHHKRESVPVLRGECVYGVLLQVCDALTYLHSRQLVMRSLSSHNVMMLTHTHAKLTGLGFISAEDGSVCVCGPPPALPPVLYNWAAPEVIAQQHCTHKADIYSVCCLLQEIYTDALPWGRVCVEEIFDQLERGCGLLPHPSLPRPFYDLVELGLQPHPINRTLTLEQLRYTLTSHVKDVSDASCSLSPGAKRRQDILSPRGEQGVMRGVRCSLDSQIQQELSDLDHMLRREEERGVEDRSREEEERRRSRQVKEERRRREEEEERRSREAERWRSREEERRKSREEERRRRERERSETQRRGSGVNVVSIRKVVGERDERADEEESDTMEGESDTETEVESTTSVFTERWEESEREREKRLSYPLTLSLDDWRASLAPDTTSLDGESEAEAGLNKGAGLGGSGVCDVMSSIVLNQQVCRTLLHECERSLESAEQHSHTLSYTHTPSHTSSHTHTPLQGYDEVDCGGGGGVAVGGLDDDDGGGVVVSGAVGPPSKYTPQVDRGMGGPWARSGPGSGRGSGVRGGAGRGIEEVGAITLGGAMWLGAFPSSSEESLTMNTATTHHTHTQTGEYESVKQSRTSSYRRSSGSSSVQSEDVPPLQSAAVSPPRPHWTNEVAELVSRMACGRLGSCAAPPISSESEDYEEASGQRQPIRVQNGEYRPISKQREEYRPTSSEDAAQIPATSRHSQQDLKLESIFKSFAGAETSEDEEVCVSSSRTFITLAQEVSEGVTPAAATRSSTEQHSSTQHHQQQQLSPDSTLLEDSDSDSEMHSMIEESSMYHTPGPGTEDPTTEEEDLDVTVEVCRPASLSMDSHTGECVSALHSAEEQEEECDQELQDVRCVSCNKQIDDPSLLR
ncbi:inactive serine/threonine-protein kinase TEX14-like [Engraulis encrasicolus]|uniref:inactive serine/threonine-protein kinase TEX14-like n=1 Tax=Engraulis encrasicolus TaxID=184585 RepID=UPI002FD3D04A